MANTNPLLKTNFSYAKMLEMSPQEARKFFITEFALPVMYDMIPEQGYQHSCSGFFIAIINGKFTPIFKEANTDGGQFFFENHTIYDDRVIGNPSYIRHYTKVLGGNIDKDEQSKALEHAFKICFMYTNINSRRLVDCPLVATLETHEANDMQDFSLKLNIICKDFDKLIKKDHLLLHAINRANLTYLSEKYNFRPFNILTGEWIGLCDPTGDICNACTKIFNSIAADNAYNDPELY